MPLGDLLLPLGLELLRPTVDHVDSPAGRLEVFISIRILMRLFILVILARWFPIAFSQEGPLEAEAFSDRVLLVHVVLALHVQHLLELLTSDTSMPLLHCGGDFSRLLLLARLFTPEGGFRMVDAYFHLVSPWARAALLLPSGHELIELLLLFLFSNRHAIGDGKHLLDILRRLPGPVID